MAVYEFFSIELLRSTISAQPVYRQVLARSHDEAHPISIHTYCANAN